jgi:hypothetical protein
MSIGQELRRSLTRSGIGNPASAPGAHRSVAGQPWPPDSIFTNR